MKNISRVEHLVFLLKLKYWFCNLSVPDKEDHDSVIVDVVIVNSVMWAEGWERGERGKSQRVVQLRPDRGPEWMGIRHH
jgi:beta-xylosidase